MRPTELTTDRLTLEPLSEQHSQGMFALWSSPEVCKYSGMALDLQGDPICLPARTPADSDKILRYFLEHQKRGSAVRWAMTLTGDPGFIGAVGFNSIGRCCEMACHLHPRYWGLGLMTEACRGIISWATSHVGSTSIEAFVDERNLPSVRLIRRLGFVATGALRDGARHYVLANCGA